MAEGVVMAIASSKTSSRAVLAVLVGMLVSGLIKPVEALQSINSEKILGWTYLISSAERACTLVNLDQHLAKQAALTIWLNADLMALEVLWQRYADNLINCS